jgi:hypothetical protein
MNPRGRSVIDGGGLRRAEVADESVLHEGDPACLANT